MLVVYLFYDQYRAYCDTAQISSPDFLLRVAWKLTGSLTPANATYSVLSNRVLESAATSARWDGVGGFDQGSDGDDDGESSNLRKPIMCSERRHMLKE